MARLKEFQAEVLLKQYVILTEQINILKESRKNIAKQLGVTKQAISYRLKLMEK